MNQNKSRVDSKGKKSISEYELIESYGNIGFYSVKIETGRHHQIRAQLSKIGYPIKGDLKYGFERSNPDGGISLHARQIEFVHPVSKEPVRVIAPVPNESIWLACV